MSQAWIAVAEDALHYNVRVRALWLSTALFCASCSTAPQPAAGRTFDAGAWLDDLSQLEAFLGRSYANLEWNRDHRGLDLVALDRSTREELRRAKSDREALEAVVRFISAFRDPHLDWSAAAPSTRYDIRLTSDGSAVAVRSAGPDTCGLQPGDLVETIAGRPAREQMLARLALSQWPNPDLRLEGALRTFTNSPFAPGGGLRLTAVRGGRPVECELAPRPLVTPASASPADGGSTAPVGPPEPSASTPGAAACEAMGISAAESTAALLFRAERHPELTALVTPGNEVAAAIVKRRSGELLGWLRIPLFSEEAYPVTCAEAWEELRPTLSGSCGEACQEDFRTRLLGPRLVSAIAQRLEAFRAARVAAVLVDITDNGGGVDWVGDVARLMAPGPLECPATVEVREPAALERARKALQGLQACRGLPLTPEQRRQVDAGEQWARAVIDDASRPCNLEPAFRGEPLPGGCSALTRSRRAPCDPPAVSSATGASFPPGCSAFSSASGRRLRGVASAPVYVLMNRRTASAAELFAAVLRDNGAATLVGERSLGAGCGYIDGANRIQLRHSGLKLRAPNCVRFRRDGANEVDGIVPDRAVSWTVADLSRYDSYAEKLLASVDQWIEPIAALPAGSGHP